VRDLRIIYMGTPEFSVPGLELLIKNNFNVVAVVTAPDKPSGRGLKLTPSPVKVFAERYNIPVLQPNKLKSPEFLEELTSYKANLQVVVAFRMLPEVVWNMPEYGTFNLHASLLPAYRGAAPINWAIINGEKETGVTTFFLNKDIDTGDIIFQEKTPIDHDENTESLYNRLMQLGSTLILKTVKEIQQGTPETSIQKEEEAQKPAPKIFKNDCKIDFSKPAEEVRNFIRGMAPYPAAWTEIEGKTFKILSAEVANFEEEPVFEHDKNYTTDNKSYLAFQTGDGLLSVKELQMEGKKKMSIQDFFRGNKL
jgi:methionyl-tRNA formyltransferase